MERLRHVARARVVPPVTDVVGIGVRHQAGEVAAGAEARRAAFGKLDALGVFRYILSDDVAFAVR